MKCEVKNCNNKAEMIFCGVEICNECYNKMNANISKKKLERGKNGCLSDF